MAERRRRSSSEYSEPGWSPGATTQGDSRGSPTQGGNFKKVLVPIAALHPELDVYWEIRGVVKSKTIVKEYGNGSFFSFEMADKAGGDVRVVCFRDSVKLFFDKVVDGKELVLSRGKLKPPGAYTPKGMRCEISLEYNAEVRAVEVEASREDLGEAEFKDLRERMAELEKYQEFFSAQVQDCKSKLQELEALVKPVETKADLFAKLKDLWLSPN